MTLKADYIQPDDARSGMPGLPNPHALDMSDNTAVVRYRVMEYSTAAVQASFSSTADTSELTVYQSLDGVKAQAFGSAVTLNPTTTMSGAIDTMGVAYLIVKITATDSGETARITVIGKANIS